MAKKSPDGRSRKERQTTEETTPPLLSHKLIAQLQGAVSAAQRKRLADPGDATFRSCRSPRSRCRRIVS